MKQYFIDVSGSMDNAKIISALNTIGYNSLGKDPISIHCIDFGTEWFKVKQYIKDSYRDMDDKCILYTDGFVSTEVLKFFDEVVILK